MASVKVAAVTLCMHSGVSNKTSFSCSCVSVTRTRLITTGVFEVRGRK